MAREALAAFILAVAIVFAFSPARVALWFHEFQTALFAAQMEDME